MVELPQLRDRDEDSHTEIGSVFVANYPPFSVWSAAHLPRVAEALDRSPDGEESAPSVGLYLHIPFCRKRCPFCYYRVYTDKNGRDVEAYLEALAGEVALYVRRPRLNGRHFDFVYFGGGTPSFLSSRQLRQFADRIAPYLAGGAAREVTFECEPGTLSRGKLDTIRAIGVTRLSLGVEHFDDDILQANGRAHKSRETFRAYDWARDVGFPQINIDLIAGMVGETEAKWRATVARTLELDPDSVTIYQMEVPHNSLLSREARAAGGAVPVADWQTKRAWVDHAFRLFEASGYVVSSAYTLIKASAPNDFLYRDALWHGAEMVGTGVASFGHVAGVHYQNVDQWDAYLDARRRGELPLARAMPITRHQRLIREMILQMKLGRLDAAAFRRRFDVDILDTFSDAFRSLVDEGLAELDADQFRLTRAGLLRVDGLLPRFYESEYRGIRYS